MIKKEQIEVLIEALENGLNITDSCILAGIGRRTYYRKHEREKKFRELVEKTTLKWKENLLETIKTKSKRQWQAAAWLLERKFPDEFALKQKVEHQGELFRQIIIMASGKVEDRLGKRLGETTDNS